MVRWDTKKRSKITTSQTNWLLWQQQRMHCSCHHGQLCGPHPVKNDRYQPSKQGQDAHPSGDVAHIQTSWTQLDKAGGPKHTLALVHPFPLKHPVELLPLCPQQSRSQLGCGKRHHTSISIFFCLDSRCIKWNPLDDSITGASLSLKTSQNGVAGKPGRLLLAFCWATFCRIRNMDRVRVVGAHFVTICLVLNNTFLLNCQHKFNFWSAGRRKFTSSSTFLDVRYVPSPYRTTTVAQLWATWGNYCCLRRRTNSPPSADRRQLPTMAFGRWNFNNKNRKKNLVTSLFSLCSTRFIRAVLVGLLGLPSQNCDCHGQHGHGGAISLNSRKDTVPVGLSHERRGLWHFSKLTSWTNISRLKNTYKKW
jgi:hypothetical protein